MELLIKNGTIVNSDRTFVSDVLCIDGKIVQISENIDGPTPFSNVVDATNCYVIPGGIDPHVHMHLSSTAGFSSDDFEIGSIAALHGGTTTILDFVTPNRGESLDNAISKRISEAKECTINYSFHISPVELQEDLNTQIENCIKLGFTSFKVYMAYKDTIGLNDDGLKKVMNIVGKAGGILLIHCEMGDQIDDSRNKLVKEGKTEPKYHPESRPNETESYAVKKAIEMASIEKCPIYIVHVSTKESLVYIRKAQEKGQIVYAETCPQYLLFDESKYSGIFEEASSYVMSPPLRKQSDCEALWDAIADGTIETVGTDHCPFTLSQKRTGIGDFRKIPNGAGGVEHRLALLYTYGVLEKKITLQQFVALTSANAASIFGLFPEKGNIKEGSDADIIIWDPSHKDVISANTHHQNCEINIYEGIKTYGSPKNIILKGELII